MSGEGEISRNDNGNGNGNFLVKNGLKMGKTDFSQNFHWAIMVNNYGKDHKCVLWADNEKLIKV